MDYVYLLIVDLIGLRGGATVMRLREFASSVPGVIPLRDNLRQVVHSFCLGHQAK